MRGGRNLLSAIALTCVDEVLHGGKAFFDGRRYRDHGERVAEHGVAHDRATGHPGDVGLSLHAGRQHGRQPHRPRQHVQLLPEPVNHLHRRVRGDAN